jgi:hypothetical protein
LLVRGIGGQLILIRHDGLVRVPITKGGEVEVSWSPDPKKLILLLKNSDYIYKTWEPARSLTREEPPGNPGIFGVVPRQERSEAAVEATTPSYRSSIYIIDVQASLPQ